MPESSAPQPVSAAAPAPGLLRKGRAVRVQCDGYQYETKLLADDSGGPTLEVAKLGKVARARVTVL